MKIPVSWLREFVELPSSLEELTTVMDDLGLVVEGVEHVGEGLADVIIARVEKIDAIEGADKVRLVTVEAGNGPLEIVCGAMNFAVGNHVPLAPVGAVLPGGFEIALRKMRGVTSNGMLCSARELKLSDDHEGLMILDEMMTPVVGQKLVDALGITPDVVLDISIEGNRPDAWSVLGVARDLATRLATPLCQPTGARPTSGVATSSVARGFIDAPALCGRLTLSVLTNVVVGPSPAHIAQRLTMAGMRPISNVVDASNLVMLELGQPTHPYDVAKVAGGVIGVRAARTGESLVTLDGVERPLAQPGRGLGDAGEDCVIVDGNDTVIGLAGIMGGASSEISDETTSVLIEAAFFDPMTIARSSKRHGLRSEASNRFERGVDPELALSAVARFVEILKQSSPDVVWLDEPIDVRGALPTPPVIELRPGDIARTLGVDIAPEVVTQILEGLDFDVRSQGSLVVVPPARRLDIRSGAAGRADVIEEIARLFSYGRLPRRTPTWPQPGGLSATQKTRRRIRDAMVDLGANEVWTATLGSDSDFDVLHPGAPRVRITNPLASEESVLRQSLIVGVVRAWGRNEERGLGDVVLCEIGTVFTHPDATATPRETRGGDGGQIVLSLPEERERATLLLGRKGDSAASAVALWHTLALRLGLKGSVVRSSTEVVAGLHPTRSGWIELNGARLGTIGEIDTTVIDAVTNVASRRLGVIDLDLQAVFSAVAEASLDQFVAVPSRFPTASLDLAFTTPDAVHASDVAAALAVSHQLVQDVSLFDVYRGASLPEQTRSLAYAIRLGAEDRTLSEKEVGQVRDELIAAAGALGASLRG